MLSSLRRGGADLWIDRHKAYVTVSVLGPDGEQETK